MVREIRSFEKLGIKRNQDPTVFYINKIMYFTMHLQGAQMCSSIQYPYPPHGRSMEIPRGWRVSKVKIFKGKYGAQVEIPEGWGGGGLTQKTFRGRGIDISWNNTIQKYTLSPFSIRRKLCTLIPEP